jgi:hypothetical protein
LGLWGIRPCYLQIGIVWLYLYLFIFLLFLFLALWLWLGIPGLCWIRVGRVGILVLFLTLGKLSQFFPSKCDVGYRFVIYSLYNVEVHSFYSYFFRAFIMKWCSVLSKAFSASIEMIQVFFVFASINVLCYIYWFAYVEPSLHPWDEANLVMVNNLSDTLLDSVCHYFIEDFCIDVH